MNHRFLPPGLALATLLLSGCAAPAPTAQNVTSAERVAYHGWNGALRLHNEQVEAIIVPEIGRVMSFRFRDGGNVLWEDTALNGQRGDPTGKQWTNFGGDKSWPSPEAEWKNYTGHKEWMPPPAFDALPVEGRVENGAVVLTSPVDPFYGIRVTRRVALQKNAPVMTIETIYERVSGASAKIGVWVITQFAEPVAVYVPLRTNSMFPNGYFTFRDTPWPQLAPAVSALKITRDPAASHKLGSDADRLLWIGETAMCLVSSARVAGAEYPDRGASAEVYTNPDPKKYVELEMLGPLAPMKPGDTISRTNTYTLMRRTTTEVDAEARRALRDYEAALPVTH